MTRADSARAAYPLFQAGDGGSRPTSALQLRIEPLSFEDARRLNRMWHSRLPRITNPAGVMNSYPSYGAEFDGLWYAIAIWSNPVARILPQDGTCLELRRMAIAPDAPKNTASRMLAVMSRLIRKESPAVDRLISYQDTEVHTGCIYRAAGWGLAERTERRSRPWNHKSRGRSVEQTTAPKERWEKSLGIKEEQHGKSAK